MLLVPEVVRLLHHVRGLGDRFASLLGVAMPVRASCCQALRNLIVLEAGCLGLWMLPMLVETMLAVVLVQHVELNGRVLVVEVLRCRGSAAELHWLLRCAGRWSRSGGILVEVVVVRRNFVVAGVVVLD